MFSCNLNAGPCKQLLPCNHHVYLRHSSHFDVFHHPKIPINTFKYQNPTVSHKNIWLINLNVSTFDIWNILTLIWTLKRETINIELNMMIPSYIQLQILQLNYKLDQSKKCVTVISFLSKIFWHLFLQAHDINIQRLKIDLGMYKK